MAAISRLEGKGDSGEPTAPATKTLTARFTKRDLILYALGIGCCSDGDEDRFTRELRYAYENHPNFQAFPTFLLALGFVAQQQSEGELTTSRLGFGIQPFPPESMMNRLEDGSSCGILPKEFYKHQDDAKEAAGLPILHMSQSLVYHEDIEFSTKTHESDVDALTLTHLRGKVISVKPRRIGTFVKSETTYHQNGRVIATSQMVALILGLDPDVVVPWEAPNDKVRGMVSIDNKTPSSMNKYERQEKSVVKFVIPPTAALLYRLSGDYNPIHVEDLLGSGDQSNTTDSKPVLHGLCTLGYAMRAVLHHVNHKSLNGNEFRLTSVRCSFTKPVYVGDTLRVEIWDTDQITVSFRVYRVNAGEKQMSEKKYSEMVVDNGRAQFRLESLGAEAARTVSRL